MICMSIIYFSVIICKKEIFVSRWSKTRCLLSLWSTPISIKVFETILNEREISIRKETYLKRQFPFSKSVLWGQMTFWNLYKQKYKTVPWFFSEGIEKNLKESTHHLPYWTISEFAKLLSHVSILNFAKPFPCFKLNPTQEKPYFVKISLKIL